MILQRKELKVFERLSSSDKNPLFGDTRGTQFLSKNPPHTGRVKELVKMFPMLSLSI